MTDAQTVETLYEEYLKAALQAEASRRPMDGIFGFGKKPADDPCHTAFLDRLTELCACAADAAPEEARRALSVIIEAPEKHRTPVSVYWTLIAAHGPGAALAGNLLPEDAAALLAAYEKAYPKRTRLPVQKKMADALKKRAGS